MTPLDYITLAAAFAAILCNLIFAGVDVWKNWRAPRPRKIKFENKTVGEWIGDGVPW